MTDYIHLRVDLDPCTELNTDLMAAGLGEIGYESFVADKKGLSAYIPECDFNLDAAEDAISSSAIGSVTHLITTEKIVGEDWNQEWEKNYFQPIVIGNQCAVRSSFHNPTGADMEIVIDPKMAFGTGHHQTTSQMMEYLLGMDLKGKKVIDMGAGTGILSILADKKGAEAIGIEIDPDAAQNARDNALLNESKVVYLTGDASRLEEVEEADVFLANINRNIILADLGRYASKLKEGGEMLLSGFYRSDIPLIQESARARGLELVETRSSDDWAALRLIKTLKN